MPSRMVPVDNHLKTYVPMRMAGKTGADGARHEERIATDPAGGLPAAAVATGANRKAGAVMGNEADGQKLRIVVSRRTVLRAAGAGVGGRALGGALPALPSQAATFVTGAERSEEHTSA